MISGGIRGPSEVSIFNAANQASTTNHSPRLVLGANNKTGADLLTNYKTLNNQDSQHHGLMYRRGTSVAINDYDRDLTNLLPIDDYFDDRE